MNILILEDDRTQRFLHETVLESETSHNIIAVATIKDALSILDRHTIHGAILDMIVPDGNGIMVANACEKKGIPIVFCTTVSDPHNLGLMYELGFILGKPVSKPALLMAVKYFERVQK